jgi:hypothetical protein
MAFGIPGASSSADGGEFLGRINCDARTGFWTITRRVQGADGLWQNDTSAPFQNPSFLVDFGTLEVGYIKIASPPAFLLVPYGHAIPPQPQEMTQADAQGKQRKAFSPGFRVKVMSKATFGDAEPYYFSANSKTLLNAVDALHQVFLAAPEAAIGKVPVVKVDGTDKIVTKTPQGSTTFYAPRFLITQWVDRPAALGERTVPAPRPGAAPSRAAPAAPPANHVPPPPAHPVAPPATVTTAAAIGDDLPF